VAKSEVGRYLPDVHAGVTNAVLRFNEGPQSRVRPRIAIEAMILGRLLVPAILLPVFWFRRNSVRARWRNIIDPLLLEHLIVGDTVRRRIQPIHTLALLIVVGAIAVGGPTWQHERPPFNQDKAPLVIVLELAHSMDATDVAPTRLERAKQKVLDLAAARKGARTGLVVFASTAHLVVPATEDPAMLELYLPALGS